MRKKRIKETLDKEEKKALDYITSLSDEQQKKALLISMGFLVGVEHEREKEKVQK